MNDRIDTSVENHSSASLADAPRDLTVPLDRLYRSPNNVRRQRSAQTISQLAAMIRAMGLLQRLLVTQGDDGRYAVEGGARRLAALEMLAAEGHLASDAPIDCRLFPSRRAVEVSLAENCAQEKMHPADEYEAFVRLIGQGQTVAQVAAPFGLSVQTVERRLALGRLEPRFLDLYRAGEVDREQLQALALTSDTEQQVAVWNTLPPYQRSAYHLRQALLREDVRADSDLARFVGIEAYVAAGGGLRRDLFSEDSEGWLTDRPLLTRLAAERLEALAQAERQTGWSWVEAHLVLDASTMLPLQGEAPGERALTCVEAAGWTDWLALLDEAQAEATAAQRAYMEADPGSDAEEAAAVREDAAEAVLESLEEAMEVLRTDMQAWSDTQKATCGVLVSIGAGGVAAIQRGLRRIGHKPTAGAPSKRRTAGPASGSAPDEPARTPLSERLMLDLTSHRTAAMQAALVEQPHVALALVVHRLALPIFCSTAYEGDSPLKVRPALTRHTHVATHASGYLASPAAAVLDSAQTAWGDRVPGDEAAAFEWLLQQEEVTLLELLAFCAASALDAVSGHEPETRRPADRLAEALDLDMADWWCTTPASYLGRVSKAQIAEAVEDACGVAAAQPLLAMKKADSVAHAAVLLEGKRWLPRPLRRRPPAGPQS